GNGSLSSRRASSGRRTAGGGLRSIPAAPASAPVVHQPAGAASMSLFSADIDALSLLAQAAAAGPQIDGAFAVRLLSRVLHISFAIIIGGGLFYLRTVLAPAGPDACFADRRT